MLFPKLIACTYRNIEKYTQIIRVVNSHAQLERAVSPNQRISFNTTEDALLEVHGGNLMAVIHEDTIPCLQLKVISNLDTFVRKESKAPSLSLAA
jgi:hypothetical protein